MSTRGKGWLIAGAVICLSATTDNGILSMFSTITLGLVFAAVFFLRNLLDAVGVGWFVAGGMFLAFCVEPGDVSSKIVAIITALICMSVFCYRNWEQIADLIGLPGSRAARDAYTYEDAETDIEPFDPYEEAEAPSEDNGNK